MLTNNKLSDLMEIDHLKADQEGMLRGGFAVLADFECKHGVINGNCDCNKNSSGCMGNGNCQCNATCDHNYDCNCNCVTTAAPTKGPTGPTGPTGGSNAVVVGMGLFAF